MARGTTTTGRVQTTADPIPTTVTCSSKCDTQSSGSLQYETTASPKGGTVFMSPLSLQRRDMQLQVPRNTKGLAPYIELSFIQCFFFFLTPTVSVATA